MPLLYRQKQTAPDETILAECTGAECWHYEQDQKQPPTLPAEPKTIPAWRLCSLTMAGRKRRYQSGGRLVQPAFVMLLGAKLLYWRDSAKQNQLMSILLLGTNSHWHYMWWCTALLAAESCWHQACHILRELTCQANQQGTSPHHALCKPHVRTAHHSIAQHRTGQNSTMYSTVHRAMQHDLKCSTLRYAAHLSVMVVLALVPALF